MKEAPYKMTVYTPCGICKDKKGPMGLPGFFYVDDAVEKTHFVEECSCHKKWVELNRILIAAKKSKILKYPWYTTYDPLKDYKGTTSLTEVKNLISYVDNYHLPEVQEYCLYLFGNASTQKTTLAHWVGLSLLKQGYSVYYNTMHNLINEIIPPTFDQMEDCKKRAESLYIVDCLIIDNCFNKQKFTLLEHQSPYIETFLRERIDTKKKGVIFVGDIPIDQIKNNKLSSYFQEFIEQSTKGKVLTFKDISEKFNLVTIFSK
jgi:hypothetical protein